MKLNISRKRKRQVLGMSVGLFLGVTAWAILTIPSNEHMLSLGPMNTGHEELECQACHTKAKGNPFQQIHANILYLTGQRKTMADFGMQDVDNAKCISCHDRPNDRHPVHRFEEPRFEEARLAIGPEKCESCHLEHKGVRLTINETSYCINCHSDLNMKNDPLDVPHVELIQNAMWTSCLQCHDFHGNHLMEAPEKLRDTIETARIKDYFLGGPDPYGDSKKYKVEKTEDNQYKEASY
ncbi:cytochrome c3 family protein [Cytophagaceae bacterium ABcell3]|nr:cytochrome c3 family protein [Cytophagaceae bacterium ABcell3]